VSNVEDRFVCIIIPVLNESKTIKGLVESILTNPELSQTYTIIVDDGSTDGTLEIIQDLDKKNKNVSIIERGNKMGIGTAIRDGFNYARAHRDIQCALFNFQHFIHSNNLVL